MVFLSKSHNVKVTNGAQMSYNKTLKTNKRLDACFSRVLVWFIRQLTKFHFRNNTNQKFNFRRKRRYFSSKESTCFSATAATTFMDAFGSN